MAKKIEKEDIDSLKNDIINNDIIGEELVNKARHLGDLILKKYLQEKEKNQKKS